MSYKMRHQSNWLLVTAILLVATIAACGSSNEQRRGQLPNEAATAQITVDEHGLTTFTDVAGPLANYRFYQLVPADWPEEAGERPIIAVGEIGGTDDQIYPVTWASRQRASGTETRVEGVRELPELDGTKRIASITEVSGTRVRISKGLRDGVSNRDQFFLVDRERHASLRPTHFAERITGIAEVVEVGETYALADIVHQVGEHSAGDVAVFAQVQSEDSIPSATLAFAPILGAPQSVGPDGELPAIAAALPDFLANYLISNVIIDVLDGPIDPKPWNAADSAQEQAPEDSFGTLIFGEYLEDDEVFIYNATYFGTAPHPANTVGILPGGLRIPSENGVEDVSKQLAPSFVATALAQRHEHAVALYLIELALRGDDLSKAVRYHIREHLALRYHSLGMTNEAIRIMGEDVNQARATDDIFAELNARSIRSFLYSETGDDELLLADTTTFLELAQSQMPPEALYYERLAHARALRANGEHEQAMEIILEIHEIAQANDDEDLLFSSLFQLAITELEQDQAEAALLVLSAIDDLEERLEPEQLADLRSVTGVLYAEAGQRRDSATRIVESLRIASELNDPALRARIAHRAASALVSIERTLDSIQYLQAAVIGYTDSYQYDEAAEALTQLAYQELNAANESSSSGSRRSGAQLVALAREHLATASESLVILGRELDAATQYFSLGVLEFRIGAQDGARVFFDRARRFAYLSGDYEALASIAGQRAALAREIGDTISASDFQAEAEMWAAFGDIELPSFDVAPDATDGPQADSPGAVEQSD